MRDLRTQLRGYFEEIAPPLSHEEVRGTPRVVVPAPPAPASRPRRLLPALVGALVVLLVVGGAGFLVRFLGLGPVGVEPIGPYGSPPAFRATIERRIPSEAVAAVLAAIAEEQLEPPPTGPTPDRVLVLQLSFDGTESWRLDFVSDSFPIPGRPEESVGSFWVTDGRQVVQYWAEPNIATDVGGLPSPLNLLSWDGTATAQQFWAEQCPDPEILRDEEVAGRRAGHARCGVWELWVDGEHGLVLRLRLAPGPPVPLPVPSPVGVWPGETLQVTEVEFRPTFPEETFQVAAPPGAEPPDEEIPAKVTRFTVGEEAPTWTAPLLSGGELDLASLRGKPVALLFWASWCPPCLDDAAIAEGLGAVNAPFGPFEAAYSDHQDEVHFVSVAYEDDPESVRSVVEETGHQVPVALLAPSETGEGWNLMGIPTLIFLDEEGRFLGGFAGVLPAEDVARAIGALAAGEPLPQLFLPDTETGKWP